MRTIKQLPPKLKPDIQFFDHQIEGVNVLSTRLSLILADDPGLGKTLQTLTTIAVDFALDEARRVLLVVPASLKMNWALEIQKFTHFTWRVLSGTPDERRAILKEYEAENVDLLIVNYEQLTGHKAAFTRLRFDVAVFDEAHALKSNQSKRTAAALGLTRDIKRKLFLTGTPMLGHVVDLWPMLHMIQPFEFPNFYAFRSRYAVMGGFQNRQVVGLKNEDELRTKLDKYMLRRKKGDVLDLPDKQYIRVFVELHPAQQEMYDEANEELRLTLPDEPTPLELENALTKFLRLRQICGTTLNFTDEDLSVKLDVVVNAALEVIENGKPVIVFTQFIGTNTALQQRFAALDIPAFAMTGATPIDERAAMVDDWSESTSPMIAQIQVAGVGLNMTAANTVIFAEKTFTPALNNQAVDRVHRIGQDKTQPVQVIEVLTLDTIEERVEEILGDKQEEFDMIVNMGEFKARLYKEMKGIV